MNYDVNPAPPWVTKILNRNWDAIKRASPVVRRKRAFPQPASVSKRGKMTFEELGCGHYGCVILTPASVPAAKMKQLDERAKALVYEMPVHHPELEAPTGVVFKLTSDESEAAFVAAACSLAASDPAQSKLVNGGFPEGMVRYFKIVQLDEIHRGRRVFGIWREEAYQIGFALDPPRRDWFPFRWLDGTSDEFDARREAGVLRANYVRYERIQLAKYLDTFRMQAAKTRDYIKKAKDPAAAIARLRGLDEWAWKFVRNHDWTGHLRGAEKAAVALQHCRNLAEEMEHTHLSSYIGGALKYYLDHGMLLADVHGNNIGRVTRPADEEGMYPLNTFNLITDPGHMVPIDVKWLDISVKRIRTPLTSERK